MTAAMDSSVRLDELVRTAVDALTAAALATDVTGRLDAMGEPIAERGDFGAIACQVITTVAANLGGVGALLAGRPGSLESDLIEQIVQSCAPEEELLALRTAPVRLILNPEDLWFDLGVGLAHDEDSEAIYAEMEQLQVQETDVDETGAATVGQELPLEADARYSELVAEADAVEALQVTDMARYVADYNAAAIGAARALGITTEVTVELSQEYGISSPSWDCLAEQLHAAAWAATPLPSGLIPAQYPPGADCAEADRAAGRNPRARLGRGGPGG